MAEEKPRNKGEDRKNAAGYLGTGAGLIAAGEGGNYALGQHLKRLKAKGGESTPKAIIHRKVKPVHAARTGAKIATRVSSGVGIPLAAYGAWNMIHPKENVRPVDLRRDVLEPAGRKATYRNEAEAVAARLREVADSVDKRLSPSESDRLHRHKNTGRNLSLAGGTIGLTALALRSPEAARGLLKLKGLKGNERLTRLAAKEQGATRASNTLLAVGGGLGAAGAFNYAAQQKLENKALEKADGEYFRNPKPLERDAGRSRRLHTEVEHQVWRGAAGGLAGASTAAVGARWLGHRRAPETIAAGARLARAKGVPDETVKINRARLERVGRWASNKRGRLLAASVGLGGAATATGAVSRWKRDESQGISQDLGRSGAGKDYIKKAGTVAAGIELGQLAARHLEKMPLQSRQVLYRAGAIGGGSALGTAAVTGTIKRQRRLKRERAELAAGQPLSKRDDAFLRSRSDRISTKAEEGYRYLLEGRNAARRDAAAGGVGALAGAGGVALSLRNGRKGVPLAVLSGLAGAGSGVGGVAQGRKASVWESKMAKIRAKALEREALGEYGRDRVVVKREPKKKEERSKAPLIGAAAAGAGAAAVFPRMQDLPDDGGASARISQQLGGKDTGNVKLSDIRGVVRGEGARFANDTHTARLASRIARDGYDENQPIEITQTRSGQAYVSGGHHRLRAKEDLGHADAPVRIIHSRSKKPRSAVPMFQSGKYVRDVVHARQPRSARPMADIERDAARPIPKWAERANKVKSKVEESIQAAKRPRNAIGLAALGGAAAGGLIARRKHNETTAPKKVRKSFPATGKGQVDPAGTPLSAMSVEDRAALRARLEASRQRKAKPLGPLEDRGKKADVRGRNAEAAQRARTKAWHARVERSNPANQPPAKAITRGKFFTGSQARVWSGLAIGGAAGAAALKHRSNQRREEPKKKQAGGVAGDVALGAATGVAARELGNRATDWGLKRGIQAYREQKLKDPETARRSNASWKKFQAQEGFTQFGVKHPGDRVDMTQHKTQIDVGSRYPKDIPGGQAQRILAGKHHPAIKHGTRYGVPLAAAAMALRSATKKEPVEKALFPVRPSHLRLRTPKMYLPEAAGSSARMKAPRVGHLRRLPGGSQVTVRGTTR
jgi:hypothetical protein